VHVVLEGSVRTSGDKLRITAQLVNGRSCFDVWSEVYDSELKHIFLIQSKSLAPWRAHWSTVLPIRDMTRGKRRPRSLYVCGYFAGNSYNASGNHFLSFVEWMA
jgi:hypothetical protein